MPAGRAAPPPAKASRMRFTPAPPNSYLTRMSSHRLDSSPPPPPIWKRLARRLPPLQRIAEREAGLRARIASLEEQLRRPPLVPSAAAPPPAAAPAGPPIAHLIDVMWCDCHGLFVKGWAHAYAHRVRSIAVSCGENRVEITELRERADLLAHFPDHPHVVRSGFEAYLPGEPFAPVMLHVMTDAGTACLPVHLPHHLRPEAQPPEPVAPFGPFLTEMKQRRGTVLEVGARQVGTMTRPNAALFEPECRFLGSDIHPGAGIDVVADAHFLSEAVGRGTIDGIFSVAVMEHLAAPWLVAAEINRSLRMGGLTFQLVPQSWPIHETPNDFFRMSDEALKSLFGPATGFEVLDVGMAKAMSLHPAPSHRVGAWLEMPYAAGYGEAFVLARKVAEIPPGAIAWPAERAAMQARSEAYPTHAMGITAAT